jgi:hypothetical protein
MIEPPAREMEVAVLVMVPPHCESGGVTTVVIPVGKLSEKETPVKEFKRFGLTIVKVRVDVPPTAIGFGEKILLMDGATILLTVTLSVVDVTLAPPVDASLAIPYAVLVTKPAVTSAAVTRYPNPVPLLEQVILPPGGKMVVEPQAKGAPAPK